MNDIPLEDTSMPPNTQVDQFVKISQTIKRRLEEDTPVPPKKVCQTLSCKEVAEDSRPPSTLEDPLLQPQLRLDPRQDAAGRRQQGQDQERGRGGGAQQPAGDSGAPAAAQHLRARPAAGLRPDQRPRGLRPDQ